MGEIADVQNPVVKYARARGVLVYKINAEGRKGFPDCLFLYDGRVLVIEFKASGKRARALQGREIAKLEEQGIPGFVVDNACQGHSLVDCLVKGNLG